MVEHKVVYTELKQRVLLALAWPFCALIFSIKEFRYPYAKNLFWFFCMFVGMTFIVSSKTLGADSERYAIGLIAMHNQTFLSLHDVFHSLYMADAEVFDVYQPLLTFLVSRITGNPHVLFFCFAVVFGFFYSRNIWFVLDRCKNDVNVWTIPVIVLLALLCPIWYINGVRMWTALQVFVYGALPLFYEGNYKRLFWCFASVLIHFSFVIPLAILLLFMVLPKKWIVVYLVLFIISSLVREINLALLSKMLSGVLPSFLMTKFDAYSDPTHIEQVQNMAKTTSIQVILAGKVLQYIVYVFVLVIWYKGREELERNDNLRRLFAFSLFIYSISQIAALVPSGGRFVTLSNMFMFSFFAMFMHSRPVVDPFIEKTLKVSFVFVCFVILFQIRIGLDFLGVMTFIGNPLSVGLSGNSVPIMQMIK
jgi:hypothetical protein